MADEAAALVRRSSAIVLAGGEGKRLMPLTADRAKPAVPFGGIYRLIDFALSNVVNSGYLKVVVLTQYKSHSLDRARDARPGGCRRCSATTSRPCRRSSGSASTGTSGSADAIFQSLNLDPRRAARHRRRRRRRPRLPHGLQRRWSSSTSSPAPACTVAAIRQPISLADQFGVIEVDDADPSKIARVPREAERPQGPARLPRRGARLDGQLRLRRRRARWTAVHARPRRSRARTTTWAATSCRHFVEQRRGRRLRLQGQRGARRHRPRPRLLARRRDDRLLLRRAHGPHLDPPGLQPLQLRVADLHRARPLPAGQVRARPAATASARRSTRRSPPASSSRAPTSTARCSRRACTCTRYAEHRSSVGLLDGVEVGRHAAIRRAIIDKNVVIPEATPDRHRPRARPGSRLPRHRDRHRRRRQGPGRHP